MPWDVLVNRLDRYLRIGYVSAVLAGLAIAAEVTVLALSGSPEERRDQFADAATSVAEWKPNAILIVFAVAGVLTAAYLVGIACRSLSFAIFDALANLIRLTRFYVARWWSGSRGTVVTAEGYRPAVPGIRRALDNVLQNVHARWRRARGVPADRPPRRLARQWIVVLQVVGQSLMRPLLPPVMRTAALWTNLDSTYGGETVNRMLERHPIKVRVSADVHERKPTKSPSLRAVSAEAYKRATEREHVRQRAEADLNSSFEYCQLWLQRYASEVAIPSRASRILVLGTAALPAILLPRTLQEIGADLDGIQSLIGPLRLALAAAAIVLFFGALRETGAYAVATFQRFVVVELAEATRREADVPNRDAPPATQGGD